VSGARALPPFLRFSGQPRGEEISPLAASDQRHVLSIFSNRTTYHLHQDWHTLPELIRAPSLRCWVARDRGRIQALVGATIIHPPPNPRRADQPTAWLRMVFADHATSNLMLDHLWETLIDDLRANQIHSINLLMIDLWIEPAATRWRFQPSNTVISLRRHSREIPASAIPAGVTLRPATHRDFDAILAVDSAAFEPLWQYDREMMDLARRHAATLTMLERNGQAVGYQLSTWHIESGHLARLALLPEEQGRGLGGLLIEDMLHFFGERSTYTITVNTQKDNLSSQRLYQKYGFEGVSQQVAVWTTAI